MGYAVGQPPLWPFPPDWSNPVSESLVWLTDAMQAATGGAQVRDLRDAPRRSFSIQCTVDQDDRRIVDAFGFDIGVQPLMLPIYPDVQLLGAALAIGATSVPCRTAGFDFVIGGSAVLWQDVTHWELVTVAAIAADALTLSAATVATYPLGSRLYPVRKARLTEAPQTAHQSDEAATVQAQFIIDEPCDWTPAWPSTATYRGLPVLEWRNEESDDPTDEYDRMGGSVDQDVGPVFYFDLPGMPFRTQSQRFQLLGRDRHSAFRALAYQLAGRVTDCWVPSWEADVRLAQPVAANATQISVAWMGYTQFGYLQPNRRDLRLELLDGTVLYRRITGSAETGATEVLQLDSALGVAVSLAQVRQINWLSVCALAADTVTIEHDTDADGLGVATLNWQAVKSDV